ncbi:hypothetical protein Vadar_014061 [Vaccinium darrowii]|uniref:Uncharacterized protein n=1 Tax=Vaccinium darrowii TaxID=229202 RepID=A0ACB7Z4N2_9ERIC|nr:hypothetical protein Vadar_014061 [Vaccinium darrowii]
MACYESDFGATQCEKHSNHRQQQGVCPACLCERLSYLKSINSCTSSCSSSPSSSSPPQPYSSTSSSAYASPPHRRRASDFAGSIGFIIGESTCKGLSKSRSVAVVTKNLVEDTVGRKKKGGFWSKLFRSTSKSASRTKEVFGHSRNLKESLQYYY